MWLMTICRYNQVVASLQVRNITELKKESVSLVFELYVLILFREKDACISYNLKEKAMGKLGYTEQILGDLFGNGRGKKLLILGQGIGPLAMSLDFKSEI